MAEESEGLLATANLKPLKNSTSDIITAKRTCLDTDCGEYFFNTS